MSAHSDAVAEPVVSLRAVSKGYSEAGRRRAIFDGLDMAFRAAEVVALLGRSGSGKSTLLNLISGIDLPDSGEVWVRGMNLASLSENARTLFRRRHVGFVFQSFNLLPTLTAAENIMLPMELNGMESTEAHAQACDWLEQVGLADRAASFPDRLSGGEQQRVAIARAVAHKPALLLADEPTGNLDLETASAVLRLLEQLARQEQTTLVLVTHSPEAAAIADRTLRLRGGRIEEVSGAGPVS